jgi:hypothetical protein
MALALAYGVVYVITYQGLMPAAPKPSGKRKTA